MLLSAETRQYLTGFSSGLGSRGGDGRRKAELPGFHSVMCGAYWCRRGDKEADAQDFNGSLDVKRWFSASIFLFLEINNAIDCQKVCPELFFTPSQMPRQGTGLALLSESAGGVDGLPSPAVAVEGSPLEFSVVMFLH